MQIHSKENNQESQSILNENKEHFSNQCKIVYDALLRGERLTTVLAAVKYNVGDLRRRVKDLKDFHNVPIKTELQDNRYKIYYL